MLTSMIVRSLRDWAYLYNREREREEGDFDSSDTRVCGTRDILTNSLIVIARKIMTQWYSQPSDHFWPTASYHRAALDINTFTEIHSYLGRNCFFSFTAVVRSSQKDNTKQVGFIIIMLLFRISTHFRGLFRIMLSFLLGSLKKSKLSLRLYK